MRPLEEEHYKVLLSKLDESKFITHGTKKQNQNQNQKTQPMHFIEYARLKKALTTCDIVLICATIISFAAEANKAVLISGGN